MPSQEFLLPPIDPDRPITMQLAAHIDLARAVGRPLWYYDGNGWYDLTTETPASPRPTAHPEVPPHST